MIGVIGEARADDLSQVLQMIGRSQLRNTTPPETLDFN
jgi:hypothetical protein